MAHVAVVARNAGHDLVAASSGAAWRATARGLRAATMHFERANAQDGRDVVRSDRRVDDRHLVIRRSREQRIHQEVENGAMLLGEEVAVVEVDVAVDSSISDPWRILQHERSAPSATGRVVVRPRRKFGASLVVLALRRYVARLRGARETVFCRIAACARE
jgi:hypothetical protein